MKIARWLRTRMQIISSIGWAPAACLLFALLTAIAPFARAFYRVEVNYNEGWNVYNAALEAAHRPLYPVRYGWTSINYPMLSFVAVAKLHHFTHDYLFTARALSLLSLLCCCVLVGAIVRRLTARWLPAVLAASLCLALFCVAGDFPAFIGMDDPQMLAQVFFLAGLLVYVAHGRSRMGLAGAALLFVAGGSIKHNLIDFPLAVLLDLLLVSRRRALWFSACGMAFLAAAVALQVHYGGPYFFDELLAPRGYSVAKSLAQFGVVLGPLVLLLGISLWTAYALRKDPERRVVGIQLVLSLAAGGYFIGGEGVAQNAMFGAFLGMCILVGLFFGMPRNASEGAWARRAAYAPLVVFGWLLIPWLVVPPLGDARPGMDTWNPVVALQETAAAQTRFDQEVALLGHEPGPALCESLLRCYYAGKPYVYDPFNATRLIHQGKLDAEVMVEALRRQEYGAIQLDGPMDGEGRPDRFAPPILAAIRQNYRPVLTNEDGTIYIPVSHADLAQASVKPVVVALGKKHPPGAHALEASQVSALKPQRAVAVLR